MNSNDFITLKDQAEITKEMHKNREIKRDQLNAYKHERIQCECFCMIERYQMAKHLKLEKHLIAMKHLKSN